MIEVTRFDLVTKGRGFDTWQKMEADPDGEWVKAEDYAAMAEHAAMAEMQREALRAEVEAHKRSRQIDANELRSLRALLTECAQWLQVLLEGDKLTPKGIRELAPFIETVAAAGRDADPTTTDSREGT